MSHTKGPWWCNPEGIQSPNSTIAQWFTTPDHADARLIAAAPDLLEALKKMVDVYNRDHFMQTADCHPTDCDCGRCDRDRAVAAIAKATGGSNV